MIRYVHIRREDEVFPDSGGFAWYSTVTDCFLEFYGNQVWATWERFEKDYLLGNGDTTCDLDRFRSLFPKKGG